MTTDIQTAFLPASKLRIAVIVLAIIKTLSSLYDVDIFTDPSRYIGKGFAQYLLLAGVAIFPVLAVAALIFAFKRDLRSAIMALAAIVIVGFLTDNFPALFFHGLELTGSATVTLFYLAHLVAFPLLAVVAFVLARRNEKLAMAALFVALPTVATTLEMIIFAIAIATHGF